MKPEGLWAVILTALMMNPHMLFSQVVQQQTQRPVAGAPAGQARPAVQPAQVPQLAEPLRPNYVLGPGDVIQIRGLGEEIGDRTFRIEDKGEIDLPVIGIVRVAGLTVEQFQTELNTRMSAFYVNPRVIVTLVQFRSEPVFFVGAFNAPGIYPLQGRRTLVEMLTLVGGLAPNASRRIRLTRRKEIGPINLPNAVEDSSGKGMTIEIPFNVLSRDINPPEDLVLMPYDVVSVEKAELVYLTGEVTRPGGYELGEKESVSAVEMLSLAGGATPNADLRKARILRPISNTGRRAEIPVNLKDKLEGAGSEIPLMGGDVLYLPRNSAAERWNRVLLIAVPAATAVLVGVLVAGNQN
ncbi:MAG: polysaccharide biosynthesis/export family protein [Bryobacteraceae bacterium]|nr:polysaccharide biosynthesis/export family protein [Bryobacteraceae bacterium]